jgi:OFA family oxalate/formate antiporter-like MFS transporter
MRSRWIESHNEPQGVFAVAGNGNPSRLSHWPEQTGE